MHVQSAIDNRQSTIDSPRLVAAAKILAAYLERRCRGAAAARPKRVLYPLLRQAGVSIPTRDFDRLPALALALGLDVGTCGRGYYWMADEADFDTADANVASRFNPLRHHRDLLARRRRERFGEPMLFAATEVPGSGFRVPSSP